MRGAERTDVAASANDVVALDAYVGVGGQEHGQRDRHEPADQQKRTEDVEAGANQCEGQELTDVLGQNAPGCPHSLDTVHAFVHGEVDSVVEQEGHDDTEERSKKIFKIQDNLEKQNYHLTQLRDFLLPMLMNGQVSVVE